MSEQGKGEILSTEPLADINTGEYEIDYILMGTIEVFDAVEHEGELLSFQILKDGETYKSPVLATAWEVYRDINEIFRRTPLFSVAETAAMLELSEQRIRALIEHKQLKAQKRAGAWFLSGRDVLAFSMKERPAHRPGKTGEPTTDHHEESNLMPLDPATLTAYVHAAMTFYERVAGKMATRKEIHALLAIAGVDEPLESVGQALSDVRGVGLREGEINPGIPIPLKS